VLKKACLSVDIGDNIPWNTYYEWITINTIRVMIIGGISPRALLTWKNIIFIPNWGIYLAISHGFTGSHQYIQLFSLNWRWGELRQFEGTFWPQKCKLYEITLPSHFNPEFLFDLIKRDFVMALWTLVYRAHYYANRRIGTLKIDLPNFFAFVLIKIAFLLTEGLLHDHLLCASIWS